MPRRSGYQLLRDIAEEIEFLFDAESRGVLRSYSADPLTKRGIERSMEIICEATRLLRVHRPDIASQISDVRRINGMRNRLAHDYANVNSDIVRGTIDGFLPTLLDEVERLAIAELL